MEPVANEDRIVVNHQTEPFDASLVADGGAILQLDQSEELGVGFHLYRMEPGSSTRPHRHTCDEQFLVIEGDLTDHDGFEYRTGDLVLLKSGTIHNSSTRDGCLLAVFIATPEENLDES